MKKGKDIAAQFSGLYLVHHNCPGLEKRALKFKEHLLFLPLQGEIQIRIGKDNTAFGPGKMLYLPPNTEHSFAGSQYQGERLIALIDEQVWKAIVANAYPATLMPVSQFIRELLFHLLLNAKTKYQKSLVAVLVETLSEHLDVTSTSQTAQMDHLESRVKDFRVMSALEFIRENLANDISMDRVAKKSGLSLRSLNRLTLEQTGLSPRNVLIQYRIAKAQELFLSGKRSVTDVAMEVGYNSLSQFISAFRKVTGQLPSEYSRMADFRKK